jgi:hypothetical protein
MISSIVAQHRKSCGATSNVLPPYELANDCSQSVGEDRPPSNSDIQEYDAERCRNLHTDDNSEVAESFPHLSNGTSRVYCRTPAEYTPIRPTQDPVENAYTSEYEDSEDDDSVSTITADVERKIRSSQEPKGSAMHNDIEDDSGDTQSTGSRDADDEIEDLELLQEADSTVIACIPSLAEDRVPQAAEERALQCSTPRASSPMQLDISSDTSAIPSTPKESSFSFAVGASLFTVTSAASNYLAATASAERIERLKLSIPQIFWGCKRQIPVTPTGTKASPSCYSQTSPKLRGFHSVGATGMSVVVSKQDEEEAPRDGG